MSIRTTNYLSFLILLPLWLTACGGGGGGDEPGNNTPSPLPQGTVGAAGGTVTGPSGARVVVPSGALTQNTTIVITQSAAGAPALPAGHVAIGETFAFTPHGTSFASAATITIPFDPAQLPAGQAPVMLKTNAAQTGWETVSGVTINGNLASANVSGFSWILMSRIPPVDPVNPNDEPQRYYEFSGWNLDEEYLIVESTFADRDAGRDGFAPGPMEVDADFGLLSFSPVNADSEANGHIYSSADGKVYFAGAEAPSGDLTAQNVDLTFLGGRAQLHQYQSYQKNAANATMEIVITAATTKVADFNGNDPRVVACPWSEAPQNTLEDCNDVLAAGIEMRVETIEGTGPLSILDREVYSQVRGGVMLQHLGSAGVEFEAFGSVESGRPPPTDGVSRYRSLFQREMFNVETTSGFTEAALRQPIRIQIDLSRVPVCTDPDDPTDPNDTFNCPEFTLRTMVDTWAKNRRSSETYASAFLRDPLNVGGDVEVITTGLTPTNRPYLGREPAITDFEPQCSSGDHPDAGTLEFSADRLRIMEIGQLGRRLYVTRTGGSRGELVANIRVQGGTAIEGTHFTGVSSVVTFADGDAVPKAIAIPTIDNNTLDGNVDFSLELTAAPDCATLGDQTTVDITLVDDEAREVVNTNPSGTLDSSFGGDGLTDAGSFGGPGADMIRQPDGKFVMVGGATTDFFAARFNADGSLDTGFGGTGMVTTDVAGAAAIESAMAVAMQADGKLLVAGYLRPGAGYRLVLLRYNSDGSVDTSFGTGGHVQHATIAAIPGAVAIQPDGKIVIAGQTPIPNNFNDYADALLARFHPDGSLDASFGDAGSKVFDLTSGADFLSNLILLADGSMVVSGESGVLDPDNRGGVAKLTANGQLDPAFGVNGKWTIPGAHLGYGLAVQPDGKLLVVGGTTTYPSSFALMRLNADGSADASFGSGGAVTANIGNASSGIGDYALAVQVSPGGQIYVAGRSGTAFNTNFGLARFTSTGVLDSTFAGDGSAIIDFSGQDDLAENIVLQPDGRIVLGGYATPQFNSGYGLARIHP